MIDNIEQIRQAIEIEQKHLYIDIRGKGDTFSGFILKQLHSLYRKSKRNPKWVVLTKEFETYSMATMATRRKAVQRLVKTLREEINKDGEIKKTTAETTLKSPELTDVMYIKGVGPKVANILNKLGIYTAKDLLFYFPLI